MNVSLRGNRIGSSSLRFSQNSAGKTAAWTVKKQRFFSHPDYLLNMRHQKNSSSDSESTDREVFIHDLKNIMTGALGHLSLIRRREGAGKPIGESLETVEGILRGACKMAESTLKSTGERGLPQKLSIVDVISACAGICIPPEGVGFRVQYGENLPMVQGDPVRLRQLFNNLLTNSVHAMEGKGRIYVELERVQPDRRAADPRMLRIRIIDSGPGIAGDLKEKIFQKGFSTREGGSGVGLFSARDWLRQMGGEIYFDDFPAGEGCCAVVSLPGCEEVDPRTVPRETVKQGSAGRILVLEDDPMVMDILGEMLEHLGCDMAASVDGAETVRLYRDALENRKPFRAVILDLNVPGGLGGVETARMIREIDPEARLFISSGQEIGKAMTEPSRLGLNGKLHKPYSLEELSELLKG